LERGIQEVTMMNILDIIDTVILEAQAIKEGGKIIAQDTRVVIRVIMDGDMEVRQDMEVQKLVFNSTISHRRGMK